MKRGINMLSTLIKPTSRRNGLYAMSVSLTSLNVFDMENSRSNSLGQIGRQDEVKKLISAAENWHKSLHS